MESRRFRGGGLDGLVGIGPETSGIPFWVWCWNGGLAEEAEPMVLVTRGPSLLDYPSTRVSVYPEVGVIIDGPLIEAGAAFNELVAWLDANRTVICGYWHQIGPVWADNLLAQIRPAPV